MYSFNWLLPPAMTLSMPVVLETLMPWASAVCGSASTASSITASQHFSGRRHSQDAGRGRVRACLDDGVRLKVDIMGFLSEVSGGLERN